MEVQIIGAYAAIAAAIIGAIALTRSVLKDRPRLKVEATWNPALKTAVFIIISDRMNKHPLIFDTIRFENKKGTMLYVHCSESNRATSDTPHVTKQWIHADVIKREMEKHKETDIPLKYIFVREETDQVWYKGKVKRNVHHLFN